MELKYLKSQVKKLREDIAESYFIWEMKDGFFCFFRRLRHFFFQVVRVFQYIPVIWKDEDWDYEYLLELMDYKLGRMEKRVGKFGTPEEVEQIRETRKFINNYINYEEGYARDVEPEPFELDFDISTNGMVAINKATNKPLTEEEDKIHTEYIKNQYKYQEEQWGKIWDNLKKYLQGWWD